MVVSLILNCGGGYGGVNWLWIETRLQAREGTGALVGLGDAMRSTGLMRCGGEPVICGCRYGKAAVLIGWARWFEVVLIEEWWSWLLSGDVREIKARATRLDGSKIIGPACELKACDGEELWSTDLQLLGRGDLGRAEDDLSWDFRRWRIGRGGELLPTSRACFGFLKVEQWSVNGDGADVVEAGEESPSWRWITGSRLWLT
ncbi:hypothetical protein M0R45_016806 [Rubus argutus]|uniref:Uncharacterized protein n=1 Tax=Rubus argutus TaxID=59490 RepID=A0AAW1XU64_RUBAR